MALSQRHGLPELVGRILAARGVAVDDAEAYLDPTLRALMPDPSALKDMDRAADRIARAIEAGERIAVFGDYDVDGATSAALLLRYLRALGGDPLLHIPDRMTEGYGPNAPALRRLQEAGAGLAITVDCGTMALEPLAAAAAGGLDIIVLDHHIAAAKLPAAHAVVNPNRLDDSSGLGNLAACGVTFLTLVAVNRALRRDGAFAGRAEPDLLGLLDLVALGTVCDVVPLTGLNRALVIQGLKVMARRHNPGLRALSDVARVTERIGAYHLGYILGPRVNAGGRIGRSDLGARLLSTEDEAEAAEIAAILDSHNDDRKTIEAEVQRAAMALLDGRDDPGPVAVAAGEGWHPGVVGIVAGRLKDRYDRPTCIVALEGGIGRASCRSVPGVDIGAAVAEARAAGLLESGGGHPMAAGFAVRADNLAALVAFLHDHVRGQGRGPLVPVTQFDGTLAIGAATPALAATVERLGPFGAGNPEPRFVLTAARAVAARVVGADHVSCFLTGAEGGRLKAIAFRALETPLGQALLDPAGAPLHLAGVLRVDRWKGQERAQFQIDDGAPVWRGDGA
ncbi:MAG: single-stranded-DNA-specific exonuclease RecJ [Inquilinus sp.]|nr:single-stranded-DNA-specific exonuclease RecJ [Inquilinus sp.]